VAEQAILEEQETQVVMALAVLVEQEQLLFLGQLVESLVVQEVMEVIKIVLLVLLDLLETLEQRAIPDNLQPH
jgi:hypothetical protein